MAKIDSRLIELPSAEGVVYVIKDGTYEAANTWDMTETWAPGINGEDIVLTVDEDMTPYQLTGSNTTMNIS